jgi:hypothetical protein
MNETQLPYKVKHYLDLSTETVAPDTAGRLRAARQRALAHMPAHSARLGLAGFGHLSLDAVWPALRSVTALAVLAGAVVGMSYWDSLEQASEYAEVDTALLADDLPINAYLDRGFDQWLKDSSPQ